MNKLIECKIRGEKIVDYNNLIDEIDDLIRFYLENNSQQLLFSESDVFELFIVEYNIIMNRNIRILCDKTKKQIVKLASIGVYMDDIKKALKNAKNDEFHIRKNYKYLTPEFITRVDKYQRYATAKKRNASEATGSAFD